MSVTTGTAQRAQATPAASWLLAFAFFLTGITGLIYQQLWARLLALTFGVTVYAAAAVLASFMAGLGLGSLLAGLVVDRSPFPLRWYGIAEVLVGLSALGSFGLLHALDSLYFWMYPLLGANFVALTGWRFFLSFVVLLVPATLMGATLPIVLKCVAVWSPRFRESIGWFYGVNTAGGLAGALLTGFYLMGSIGVRRSFYLAAAINIAVGLAVLLACRLPHVCAPGTLRSVVPPPSADDPAPLPGSCRRALLFVFAVSGFVSLGMELVWFRLLVLYRLSVTAYSFSLMLGMVLAGIAVGSVCASRLMRRLKDPLLALTIIELAVPAVMLFSVVPLGWHTMQSLVEAMRIMRGPTPLFVSAAVILPTSVLLGIAFPLGLSLWSGQGNDPIPRVGRGVGLFYALNLAGAVLGAPFAALVLLPALGLRLSLVALSAGTLLAALLLLSRLAYVPLFRRVTFAAAAVLLAAAGSYALPDVFAATMNARFPGQTLLSHYEGIENTVTVQQEGNTRTLYINGNHQADDSPGMADYHRSMGHLGMLLHPNPRRALVIGLGGGATAGAISLHPVQLDIVELSTSVVGAAPWFRGISYDVLHRPNVRLLIDDGRNYLHTTTARYDLVTADLILPHHAGAGYLYSVEYFQAVRDVLTDDGLFVQWNGADDGARRMLLTRSFLSVFPAASSTGSLLLGSKHPLKLDRASFEEKLRRNPALRALLQPLGLADFDSLLSLGFKGPEELARLAGPGPLLTDDRPVLEFFLSSWREAGL